MDKKELREKLKANPKVIGKVYLNISDSGVGFVVQDEGYGPTIKITGSAFGQQLGAFRIHTDRSSLRALAQLFSDAAEQDYSGEYVCKAHATSSTKIEGEEQDEAK